MSELGCSTISFCHRPLPEALAAISALGMSGIDLGGLPGVCEHIPTPLDRDPDDIVEDVRTARLDTWAINVDPGPLNDPALDDEALVHTGTGLVSLAARLGAALIVPCGAPSRTPFVDESADLARMANRLRLLGNVAADSDVRLLVEGLHHHRFCHSAERARALLDLTPVEVAGFVFDVSHVVAGEIDEVALAREFAERIEHVHLRDAEPGEINLSIGRGRADFAGVVRELSAQGYTGRYVLELETHDVDEGDRVEVAAQARETISALLPT
ncbi:sugar phosphate isomerase/epimerase family protein [Haloactinomyces albus]|uniref:Sugar phosphate isomerase/epimerase n=1 Tax=Haloactinomyces albus TaxID=1352928 RepID=A0AAE4CRX4_9ACTN|nr:sugar phosphate isomerase/epimerase [Haloactinomyces albus]MDR7304138.1 sugar phosphate isomerase/epimerase [Haloactinomyces albus]